MAATRPLMTAEPMLRAPSPAMASESTRVGSAARDTTSPACMKVSDCGLTGAGFLGSDAGGCALGCWLAASFASPACCPLADAPGLITRESSRLTFVSIRSHAYCDLLALELPFGPTAMAKGYRTPPAGL